jgi:hypothetical protein
MYIYFKILFLFFILTFTNPILSDEIKTDEAPKKKNVNISGEWTGEAKDNSTGYSIYAFFIQDAKGNPKWYFLWMDEYGGSAKEIITGKIDLKSSIKLVGTAFKNVINKFPDGARYILGNYTAILSKDEKTITGKWRSANPGDFKLIKK